MSDRTFALGLGLLLMAACQSTGSEPAAGPTPESPSGPAPTVTVEPTAAEAEPASSDVATPAPAAAPAAGPEYHPAARRYFERMEREMKPLEAIPSLPGQDEESPTGGASGALPQTVV